ncbi:heparinase II/III-family protein, partial [Klebsiella pneumoniae]|uniref:heparinase II/III family protein n=1 Tax=Klebsiella pneumoniae TaxID=573 RepID=UPI003717E5A3
PLGYLSIAAHGHADALSLLLHLDGQPVLVDAGTYLYHAGGAVRDRLRGTAAHNTLCLDGADQSQIAGAFNWRHAAKAQLIVSEEQASG